MSLFISSDDGIKQMDITKEINDVINTEDDINILIVSDKGTLLTTKNIKEMEDKIKEIEKKIIKYTKILQMANKNPNKNAYDIKNITIQLKVSNTLLDIYKLDKMIYMFYIEKKNITKMVELLKSKYNKLFSELFEYSEELVEIGAIKESDHLDNAKNTKNHYERNIKHLDLYTTATFVLITNNPIQIN